MRLLEILPNGDFRLVENLLDNAIRPYAVLSHRWENDEQEEVTFEDMDKSLGQGKAGYKKIGFCGGQAAKDGLRYFWVDSCCIKKSDSSELTESLNSMFRWYKRAEKCYVYLSDVSKTNRQRGDEKLQESWEIAFQKSEWFTRGWTLQELLAPKEVKFFSKEGELLGDKQSLEQQIHEVTEIPILALRGSALSSFTTEQKFAWAKNRKTTREEDWAYSLLGIFETSMPVLYGEGKRNAVRRLENEIDDASKAKQCLRDLRVTDPRADKIRIEKSKGGLLLDSYRWILEHRDFRKWQNDKQSRLLWIRGNPGKGKTMLLCGIVNELKRSTVEKYLLAFFYFQANDSRINNATAVLRGLLYLLVDQQPSLISHIQEQHDLAGKSLFEDANAWISLSNIFTNVLQDPSLKSTYLIIDALDECAATDLPKLLEFIVKNSSISARVKWIVSSRNWPSIEKKLNTTLQGIWLCLELNENSVSAAVTSYTLFKVNQLARENEYDNDTRDTIQRYLLSNANGTFLWVALVCQELVDISGWEAEELSKAFPPGLDLLYKRMLDEICSSRHAQLCKSILAVISVVRRPITLDELASFVDMPTRIFGNYKVLTEIIGLCGSFLMLQERTVSFIHQSAKEFVVEKAYLEIYPSGTKYVDHSIFSRSLQIMSNKLRRDMYSLNAPGVTVDQINQLASDPLSPARYSCVYWIDHLLDCNPTNNAANDLQDGGSVDKFLTQSYLYWLEALSLCRSMSEGVVSMANLEALLQARADATQLLELVQDARRFIMYHKQAIETSPLQAYASALIFSPASSLIRNCFKKEEPEWIEIMTTVGDKWSACLQTLEGHGYHVRAVTFSHDSTRLASASEYSTIKIWDAGSGACLQSLRGHGDWVTVVTFSQDSTRLALGSHDGTLEIWDVSSGKCVQILDSDSKWVEAIIFSHDSTRLASASDGNTVKLWDIHSGKCLQLLDGYSKWVNGITFSQDSTQLALAPVDNTIEIWDTSSGRCLQTLEGHSEEVIAIAFSHDSTQLVSTSEDVTIKIWDIGSGKCLQTLNGHIESFKAITFSHDSTRLASGSYDNDIKIWDASSGKCLQTLKGHSDWVNAVTFSHDSTRLASASDDGNLKIWDVKNEKCVQTLDSHNTWVSAVTFSHDSTRLASASHDGNIKIWDASDGKCLQTLEGNSHWINAVAFSHDSTRLASGSNDGTVTVWDVSSGKCLQALKGHSDSVSAVTFSHDSTRLASASASHDGNIKIWDASDGKCLQTLEGNSHGINAVAFSHDSTRLASGSNDGTVTVWDVSSGKCLQALNGHSDSVSAVTFSHDLTQLASASHDKTVKIWDVRNERCLQMLNIDKILVNISFDATGRFLYTDIGTISVNTASNTTYGVTDIQTPRYQGVTLGPDGVWITHSSENLVWLPSEYRPSCSTVSGKTIGIGVGSGKVWICTLNVT